MALRDCRNNRATQNKDRGSALRAPRLETVTRSRPTSVEGGLHLPDRRSVWCGSEEPIPATVRDPCLGSPELADEAQPRGHCHGNLSGGAIWRQMRCYSCGRGCTVPSLRRVDPQETERVTGDEVALEVERVVGGSVGGEVALG
jgi:hypothetical protein